MSVIPDIQEAKTGILQAQGLPEQLSEILAQKKKRRRLGMKSSDGDVIKMSKALGSTNPQCYKIKNKAHIFGLKWFLQLPYPALMKSTPTGLPPVSEAHLTTDELV